MPLNKKKRPLWESAPNSPQMIVNPSYNKHIRSSKTSFADYTIIDLGGIAMDTKIQTLVAQMQEARYALNQAIEKASPHMEICPTWQLKQVLDHITGWDGLVSATLRQYQRDEIPAKIVDSIDRFNAASISTRQGLSFQQSRQAYDDSRSELLQVLQNLPIGLASQELHAPWGGKTTVVEILNIFIEHEHEHAAQIEKLYDASTPAGCA